MLYSLVTNAYFRRDLTLTLIKMRRLFWLRPTAFVPRLVIGLYLLKHFHDG